MTAEEEFHTAHTSATAAPFSPQSEEWQKFFDDSLFDSDDSDTESVAVEDFGKPKDNDVKNTDANANACLPPLLQRAVSQASSYGILDDLFLESDGEEDQPVVFGGTTAGWDSFYTLDDETIYTHFTKNEVIFEGLPDMPPPQQKGADEPQFNLQDAVANLALHAGKQGIGEEDIVRMVEKVIVEQACANSTATPHVVLKPQSEAFQQQYQDVIDFDPEDEEELSYDDIEEPELSSEAGQIQPPAIPARSEVDVRPISMPPPPPPPPAQKGKKKTFFFVNNFLRKVKKAAQRMSKINKKTKTTEPAKPVEATKSKPKPILKRGRFRRNSNPSTPYIAPTISTRTTTTTTASCEGTVELSHSQSHTNEESFSAFSQDGDDTDTPSITEIKSSFGIYKTEAVAPELEAVPESAEDMIVAPTIVSTSTPRRRPSRRASAEC